MLDIVPNGPCECYECVGSEYVYTDDGHRYVANNVKYHTLLEPCGECSRPKTEYRDLGRKGYFVCWWCRKRAAETVSVTPGGAV
ncbi:hypothetical protein [Natrinema pallidum]|uniref:Uncharacterized protein n=1 Tax=Natrinema pallidum DSM 3751 TaxID=1227495 RepID=L9YGM8_9EURY|nr:hypothetical protein [Natrinema pallidum]ELY73249.1 hypothetical protein C487_17645 [Natrinema pallidum DSM 3751]